MARRSKAKSRTVIQRQYRARLAKYEEYAARTLDPKSFKEWNEPYRQNKFLRKEYRLYKKQFEKRQTSSIFGFRLTREKENVEEYNYRDFKEVYLVTRNTLKEEVEEDERKRIGSVITEMINDQAYELSRPKAQAISEYLLREERPLLEKQGYLKIGYDEKGKPFDIVKRKKLELLIRQGQFVEEEVGLWDEIRNYYKTLIDSGFTSKEAKAEIGITYFKSPK